MKPVTCVVCGRTEPYRHGHWQEWRTGRGILAFHDRCMIGLIEQLDRERRTGQAELFGGVASDPVPAPVPRVPRARLPAAPGHDQRELERVEPVVHPARAAGERRARPGSISVEQTGRSVGE